MKSVCISTGAVVKGQIVLLRLSRSISALKFTNIFKAEFATYQQSEARVFVSE